MLLWPGHWTVISDQCKTGRGRLLALVFLTITMWYNFLTICNMCHLFASAPSEQTQSIFCLPNLVCRFARSVGGKTRLQNSWTLNSAKQLPRDKTKQNAPQDTLRWLQNLSKVEGWGQNCASSYKPFWLRVEESTIYTYENFCELIDLMSGHEKLFWWYEVRGQKVDLKIINIFTTISS